ncbi:hypothetical protein RvY_15870 [Ramazzottius varieornatus]|uniref:Solute carrier organic anion transporter family member n=1 Tax=Ramazzottius varieornatus TaxID=947166 RepID=A0A1D1VWF9_RAMVA|nr:hypothetical protein RvY_15870 [Ramazzottius varieornatus]
MHKVNSRSLAFAERSIYDSVCCRWTITGDSPAWLGAWWIGFLGMGCLALVISLPLLLFPSDLPNSRKFRAERKKEHRCSQVEERSELRRRLSELPRALKSLLSNKTFMSINLAAAADAFLVMAFSTYGPKIIQSQFGYSASTASVIMGAVTIPMGAGGMFIGGYLVKRFNLDCRGILKFCLVCSLAALATIFVLLIRCPNESFVGVNVPYNSSQGQLRTKNLVASCNEECDCRAYRYDPVCAVDTNVAFLTPCHAGCTAGKGGNGAVEFFSCSCIGTPSGRDPSLPVAKRESCATTCSNLHYIFLTFFALVILFTFLSGIPAVSATLRCVEDAQRPFAMGVQWIVVRALGSIPGPLSMGALIDTVCLYWQKDPCGSSENDGRCLVYDNTNMSNAVFAVAVICKIMATAFFFLGWWLYRPPLEEAAADMKENASDATLTNRQYGVSTTSVQSIHVD